MIIRIRNFDHWREIARQLIFKEIRPSEVSLREYDDQPTLFAEGDLSDDLDSSQPATREPFTVPRAFVSVAQNVSYHRDTDRWNLLYRILWRIRYEQPHLLELLTDDDIYRLRQMEKQVQRDAHKMRAFVRFRKVNQDGDEYYIAWHRSDHPVLRKVAPFFSRRFKAMNWSILTPLESVSWDQRQLHFGPGVPRSAAPKSDELEGLWQTYYASIFNPARVKIKAMKGQMPVRYWPTMPETELIPDLLAAASARVHEMIANQEGYATTAADFIKTHEQKQHRRIETLDELARLAERCKSCDLHSNATQTVFGQGPSTARIVMIGEQPGDIEDQVGRPFVGPAGEVLDQVLAAAGINRQDVYLTNVVKHFKHTVSGDERGKPRLHKKPNAHEVRVCKPWLQAEWSLLVNAAVLVCLGSTAATALIAPEFKVSQDRGKWVASSLCPRTIATWHPSAVLRTPNSTLRKQKMSEMVADLELVSSRC